MYMCAYMYVSLHACEIVSVCTGLPIYSVILHSMLFVPTIYRDYEVHNSLEIVFSKEDEL